MYRPISRRRLAGQRSSAHTHEREVEELIVKTINHDRCRSWHTMDARNLVRLGRVFDLERELQDEGTLAALQSDESQRGILCVAVDRGGHSALEVLLRAKGWRAAALDRALWDALHQKRMDLAILLLD